MRFTADDEHNKRKIISYHSPLYTDYLKTGVPLFHGVSFGPLNKREQAALDDAQQLSDRS